MMGLLCFVVGFVIGIVLESQSQKLLSKFDSLFSRNKSRYGWKPDLPDHRDFAFTHPKIALPSMVDLRSNCPAVYDQGQLGSCTANAIGGAIEFDLKKQNLPDFTPSRLFIYYNERAMEGTVNQDAGAMIRDGVKSIAKLGVCPELNWPYLISKFKKKPTKTCYKLALNHKTVNYAKVDQNVDAIKTALAAGFPVVFGFSVYDGFESNTVAQTGVLNLPAKGEQLLGGHAVMAVGYDDSTGRFLVRNSWGPDWGQNGYFTMPYAYLTNPKLASDLWVIRTVT